MTNTATGYGVTIERAAPNAAGEVWRAVDVAHVPAERNGDRHNVYVNAEDETGRRATGVGFDWGWEGQGAGEPAPAPEIKAEEWMANIPMFSGQRIWCRVNGCGIPSDTVRGLHTGHARTGEGDGPGHHSFAVVWRKVSAVPAPPPVVVPVQPPIVPDDERFAIAARLRAEADGLEGAAINLRHLATAVEAMGVALGMARG